MKNKGILISASTRGDGYQGENVTRNVLTIKDIPSKLKGSNIANEIEIRGEIFLTTNDFITLNKKPQFVIRNSFTNKKNEK